MFVDRVSPISAANIFHTYEKFENNTTNTLRQEHTWLKLKQSQVSSNKLCQVHLKYFTQFVNKMCSHCLFPVVDKSGTSCYHLVTRLMRQTDSQQVVPTSLISSASYKLLTR